MALYNVTAKNNELYIKEWFAVDSFFFLSNYYDVYKYFLIDDSYIAGDPTYSYSVSYLFTI